MKVDVATVDSAVDNEESVETTVFSSVVDVSVDTTKIIQCNYFFSKSTLPLDVVFVVNSVVVIVVRVDVTMVDFSVDLAVDDSVEVSLLTDGETVVEEHEYVPGRVLIFPGSVPHRGLAPKVPSVFRYTTVFRVIPND